MANKWMNSAVEGPFSWFHSGFPCNQSQACGIAVVGSLGLRRHHRRRSLALSFSFRTDLITRVTDPTRGQWRQSRRKRATRAVLLPTCGWAGNRNILNFIHERAGMGSECGLGRMTLDSPRLGVHFKIKFSSQMLVV